MKTAQLEGAALDWAVEKANGGDHTYNPRGYSMDWAFGGPIIEEEKIGILFYVDHIPDDDEPTWVASCGGERALGDTPLIAAMRCYVLLELGKDVEIPEELK